MEPLAAIGLASSILTFADCGLKVTKIIWEIYSTGSSAQVRSLEKCVADAQEYCKIVTEAQSHESSEGEDSKTIGAVLLQSQDAAGQLQELLEKINLAKYRNKLSSLGGALKLWLNSKKLKELQARLGELEQKANSLFPPLIW